MRKIAKYKKIFRNFFFSKISKRISNFKRPKWFFTQSLLNKYFSISKKKIKNKSLLGTKKFFFLQNSFRRWEKVKLTFKNNIRKKNYYSVLFDDSIKLNKKRITTYLIFDTILNTIVIPYFRIDFLLWFLFLFESSFHARQFINNGDIFVNNKKVIYTHYLQNGDVLTFPNNKYNFNLQKKINRYYYKYNKCFFSFLEIDFYTKTIVIIKSPNQFNLNDLKYFM